MPLQYNSTQHSSTETVSLIFPFRQTNITSEMWPSGGKGGVHLDQNIAKVKVKVWTLDTCYSATYMSQTRDQQRFTVSEVAADWHEPMVPQRIMWPSIARADGQLDPRCS